MKFSIVTPSFNLEKWLPATIESVISQKGDFEIEYIVVDGGSNDRSHTIAQGYSEKIRNGAYPIKCRAVNMICSVEKNTGIYEAINRGFAKATGDVYAWINSDDVYAPGAFEAIRRTLESFPDIEWVKGITSTIDESGNVMRPGQANIYRRDWIRDGIYGQESYFIEQDSVFWREKLWNKVGGIPSELKSAGDYWLWKEFAKHASLWTVNAKISSFRKREGQVSKDIRKYKSEQKRIRPTSSSGAWAARLFFSPRARLTSLFPGIEKIFFFLYPMIFHGDSEYIELEPKPHKAMARSYRV